jgi:hypothetical protein
MKEQLVSLKTAKLVKKKGFDVVCDYVYDISDKKDPIITRNQVGLGNLSYFKDRFIGGPLQSLIQKWLREEKNILVEVIFNDGLARKLYEVAHKKSSSNFHWSIYTSINNPDFIYNKFWSDIQFETYEEALEQALQQALKMVR